LTNIFNFLQFDLGANLQDDQEADRGHATGSVQIDLHGDGAAQVADLAFKHNHFIAVKAMDLFAEIYGAYAGNLALIGLTRGGVYIAGGIAPKIIDKLKEGGFISGFRTKGRFAPLMEEIPVQVVTNPKAGLLGAAQEARRMLK
jgi:glucokinase